MVALLRFGFFLSLPWRPPSPTISRGIRPLPPQPKLPNVHLQNDDYGLKQHFFLITSLFGSKR